LRYVRVAQTVGHQLQDLDLPVGQLGDVLARAWTRSARNPAGATFAKAAGNECRRRFGLEPLELFQSLPQRLLIVRVPQRHGGFVGAAELGPDLAGGLPVAPDLRGPHFGSPVGNETLPARPSPPAS